MAVETEEMAVEDSQICCGVFSCGWGVTAVVIIAALMELMMMAIFGVRSLARLSRHKALSE